MDRIAIIGGSGKSRLARALGTTLGITPVHLDGLYYDRDWKPPPFTDPAQVRDALYASADRITQRS